uniref:Evasin n=1 Tax=Amblyomma parvum TaxID=251391 RepID=A0A023FY21_AMBPA
MRALWLLNFGLLVALAASNGIKISANGQHHGNVANGRLPSNDTKEQLPRNTAAELPHNSAIPGCGDPSPTEAPSPAEPLLFGIATDDKGCEIKVLGSSQKTALQVRNRAQQKRKRRGRHPNFEELLLTVDCKKSCSGTYSDLGDEVRCLVANGTSVLRGRTIKGACFVGVCSSGHCKPENKKVRCYLPENGTQYQPYSIAAPE